MDRQNNRNNGESESTRELLSRLDALLEEDWQVGMDVNIPEQIQEEVPVLPERDDGKAKEKLRRQKDWVLMCHDLAYILAAVLLIFTFFVRVSRVQGGSMNPTLVNNDRMLLLSNVWYSEPQRGDIVVARVPGFSAEPIVKRVIAVEEDTVDIDFERGIVYVNGKALDEPYIKELTYNDFGGEGITFPLVVKQNHVFLMGDNRNDSYDSRYRGIGQVDERCILGKAIFLTMPGKDPATGKRDFSRVGLMDQE